MTKWKNVFKVVMKTSCSKHLKTVQHAKISGVPSPMIFLKL
jgi:hypothetical protein